MYFIPVGLCDMYGISTASGTAHGCLVHGWSIVTFHQTTPHDGVRLCSTLPVRQRAHRILGLTNSVNNTVPEGTAEAVTPCARS